MNDLIGEFYRGYPIEELTRLLRSDDEAVVRAGIWLASELPTLVAPLMPEISRLLEHPLSYVRFYAIDVMLLNATDEHGEALARAVALINDPDQGVREQVLRFLTRASIGQLEAAVVHLDDEHLAALVRWLVKWIGGSRASEKATDRLISDENDAQLFGVVAAARLSEDDTGPLRLAASSTQPDVRRFAESELEAREIAQD